MSVVIIKLVTGLELVGTESEVQPPMVFQLEQAFQITFENTGNKKFRQGIAPLTMATDNPQRGHGVIVSMIQVLGIYNPSKALLDSYNRVISAVQESTNNIIEMPKLVTVNPPNERHSNGHKD